MNTEAKNVTQPAPARMGRRMCLFFRLNADAMNYTPRSHRGARATRLLPIVRAAIAKVQP
jgi:hypothetical protein